MNIGCFIDENREIRNYFFRWIDLNNEILKIKWVNKSMIICGLKDWKIIIKKLHVSRFWIWGTKERKKNLICNCERQRVIVE